MRRHIPVRAPDPDGRPAETPDARAGTAAPGEWLTIDGVQYRRVVLCFLFRPGSPTAVAGTIDVRTGSADDATQVLLGLKRTGFGAGRVVALGGKIDGAETEVEAVVREIAEESGIHLLPAELREAGRISWSFPAHPAWNMVATLFTADAGDRSAVAGEEIEPRWYAVGGIPWQEMWKDAPSWVPAVIGGRRIDARIVMSGDGEQVASAVVE
jgi:8-oxo-dGTP diphosphatase